MDWTLEPGSLLLWLAKLPEFRDDPDCSLRGWLRVIVVNKWRDVKKGQRAGR